MSALDSSKCSFPILLIFTTFALPTAIFGHHTVWLERPSRVAISGLITAYYPEAVTVGGIREELKVGQFVLPEDTPGVGNDASSTAFQKDVYMLVVVCYYLLS